MCASFEKNEIEDIVLGGITKGASVLGGHLIFAIVPKVKDIYNRYVSAAVNRSFLKSYQLVLYNGKRAVFRFNYTSCSNDKTPNAEYYECQAQK